MSAIRKQIRKNIVKILNGRTAARDNVRANRGEVNWQENLPAINVYIRGEELEELDQAPRRLRRVLDMEIEIIADGQDGDDLSDKLDDLAEQVERCLSIDDSIGGCADDIIQRSVSDMEAVGDGSKATASMRLFYDVKYNTFAPRDIRDQGRFPDLEGFDTEWQVGHHDEDPTMAEADRATDKIDIP